jgi:hypothetical protein
VNTLERKLALQGHADSGLGLFAATTAIGRRLRGLGCLALMLGLMMPLQSSAVLILSNLSATTSNASGSVINQGSGKGVSFTSDVGATSSGAMFGNSNPGGWTGSSSVINNYRIEGTSIPDPGTLVLIR